MKYFILIMVIVLSGCTAWNQHMYGYDREILVRNAEPTAPLYYSIPGTLDKDLWYDMPTVQARAEYLAGLVGYEGDDIACSADGMRLLVGVK